MRYDSSSNNFRIIPQRQIFIWSLIPKSTRALRLDAWIIKYHLVWLCRGKAVSVLFFSFLILWSMLTGTFLIAVLLFSTSATGFLSFQIFLYYYQSCYLHINSAFPYILFNSIIDSLQLQSFFLNHRSPVDFNFAMKHSLILVSVAFFVFINLSFYYDRFFFDNITIINICIVWFCVFSKKTILNIILLSDIRAANNSLRN